MYILLILFLSIIVSFAFTPFFMDLFKKGNSVEKNYKGDMIPQGIGIVFPFYLFLWYFPYLLLYKHISIDNLLILFAIFAASFVGFVDDMLGKRDVLGFKGHFRSLFNGRLTTGALKAIIGFLTALFVSMFLSRLPQDIIINTFIIALSTNLINLLDLRPGRAIKFYIFIVIITLLFFNISNIPLLVFIPLIGIILGYMPYDLKARSMMGDAGSNVLGISMGIFVVYSFGFYAKLIFLSLLIAVHIFAEKYSISEVIANNKYLSFFDNLGR